MESTRRDLLKTSLAGASALGAGVLLTSASTDAAAATTIPALPPTVPFYGTHQAGIGTPAQNYLQFAAFSMVSDSVADLRKLMQDWTSAAAKMTLGHTIGPASDLDKPPTDTGEALGLKPAQLTITFGFGRSLFTDGGVDRFGLAKHLPAPLVELPAFKGDALQAAISDGDLCIQACANDPQVAFHAIHDLIKIAKPIANPSWLLAGSGRTGNSRTQSLPRNLMGFQDGTANIKVENTAVMDKFVWASEPSSPTWMRGGSYLVARRIQIALGLWDDTTLKGQEQAIGRVKVSGAVSPDIAPTSHIVLSGPGKNHGKQILRRGYAYTDGIEPVTFDAATGLLFLCYQKDPRTQFIPIQQRIAGVDALSVYLTHIGSAVFACPPGAKQGSYVGASLLG